MEIIQYLVQSAYAQALGPLRQQKTYYELSLVRVHLKARNERAYKYREII